VDQALGDVRARTGTIRLVVTESDAAYTVDGRTLGPGETGQPIRVLPGGHRLTADKAGFRPLALDVDVQPGNETAAELALKPDAGAPLVAPIAIAPPAAAAAPVVTPPPASVPPPSTAPPPPAAAAAPASVSAPPAPPPEPPPPPAETTMPAPTAAVVAPDASIGAAAAVAYPPPSPQSEPSGTRIGLVLGLVSLPRPIEAELSVKLGRILGLGFQYSLLPELSIPGVDLKLDLKAFQGIVRWFPFQGAFFVGAGFGYQTFTASLGKTVDGSELLVTADMSGLFIAPQIGWLWVWRSGLALGFGFGAQIPIPKEPVVSATYGGQPVPNQAGGGFSQDVVDSAHSSEDTVRTIAKVIVKYPFPALDLLRVGFFF
jgi:hypothetical protein